MYQIYNFNLIFSIHVFDVCTESFSNSFSTQHNIGTRSVRTEALRDAVFGLGVYNSDNTPDHNNCMDRCSRYGSNSLCGGFTTYFDVSDKKQYCFLYWDNDNCDETVTVVHGTTAYTKRRKCKS